MIRKLILMAMLPVACGAQGVRFDSNVTQAAKNVPVGAQAAVYTVPFARITVCANPPDASPCTNTIAIYQDQALTIPQPQPITADSQGRFGFWVPPTTAAVYSVSTQGGTFVGTFNVSLTGSVGPTGPTGPATSGIYDLSTYPGATGDQQLTAADAALAGIRAIITVTHAATFYNSVTMTNGHWLNIVAPIGSVGDSTHIIFPQSGGGVMCTGGAGKITSAVHDGTGFFWTANGTTDVAINGCNASGGDAGTFLVYTGGAASNVRISNVMTSGIGAHFVVSNGANVSNLSYSNVTVANSNYGLYLTGSNIQHVVGTNITYSGTGNPIEGFAIDAASFPSQAQILAANSGNWTFTNTTVHGATACAYTNGNYNVDFIGGKFDGNLGDTCLDAEGSKNIRYFNWDITKTNGNFAMSTFFTSYGNEFHHIRIKETDGNTAYRIKYAGGIGSLGAQDTLLDDVGIECSPMCNVVFEGNVNTTIKNSNWTDVQMLTIGNASVSLKVYDSWFNWDVAVPTGSGGFVLPTQLNSGRDFFQRNHIVTTLAQPSSTPALLIQSSDFNSIDGFELSDNWLEGPWPVDFQFSNTGNNVPAIFNFVNNHTQTNNFVQAASNAGVSLLRQNNCTLYEAICDNQARGSAGWQTNTPDVWNGATISGPNNQFGGRVIHNDEEHQWSQAATTAGYANDWRTGIDSTGVRTFSICPIGFGSACTVLQQFLPNGVFRVNSLGGSGNQVVCADANGSLYRGSGGTCGTPPSSLTAMPPTTTVTSPGGP